MQLVVNDFEAQSPVVLHPEPMSDDEFYDFCQLYPDCRVERTSEGEILIMPPAGSETGYRNSDLTAQLRNWAKQDGRGRAFDSNAEFMLPNGAAKAPDASWIMRSRLDAFTKAQKRKFLRICPDFVIELISPTDRLKRVQEKMREWIDNGAQLGWLLDADRRTAYVYRPGQEPERIIDPAELIGEGPVAGFKLDLRDIWEGL